MSNSEKYLMPYPELNETTAKRLLNFYRSYQNNLLVYIAKIKNNFEKYYPNIEFPGFFAGIDIVTGNIIPVERQYADTTLDCKMLSLFSHFLVKKYIPDKLADPAPDNIINLREFYTRYAEYIFEKLNERFEINGGSFPAFAEVNTNKTFTPVCNESSHSRIYADELLFGKNNRKEPVHTIPYYVNLRLIFASAAYINYGLYKNNPKIVNKGIEFLNTAKQYFILNFRDFLSSEKSNNGDRKIKCYPKSALLTLAGVSVDCLKVLHYTPNYKDTDRLHDILLNTAWETINFILEYYCDYHTGEVWEYNSASGRAFVTPEGHILCNTISAAELCYISTELCSFLPSKNEPTQTGYKWNKKEILKLDLLIMAFLTRSAYIRNGLMPEFLDIIAYRSLPDRKNARGELFTTAPYRNIRALCAAALGIYYFTGRSDSLIAYQIAQNSSYRHYPSNNIGGLMLPALTIEEMKPFKYAFSLPDWSYNIAVRDTEIEILDVLLQQNA